MALDTDIPLTTIDGAPQTLAAYAGQTLLVVNVASKCGFTSQYAGLEALHRRFAARGFAVLGFPCDQFGGQEPGNEAQIRDFCTRDYSVSFPMFAKVDVNGSRTHPLFAALKRAAPGLLGTESIKWNFTKFLIGPDGEVKRRYAPSASPDSLGPDIEALLATDSAGRRTP